MVVPARDEALTLPGLLGDLVHARREGDRVVVLDDDSTDATAAVARGAAGVEVLAAPPLPDGWTGKSWACHSGVARLTEGAGGWTDRDVVVFVDADVRLAPDALDAVVSTLGRRGGAVSVQPFHTTVRPYEELSLFCNVVSLMGIGAGRHGTPPSGLCGPLVATTLAAYRHAGGHAAVRASITEDLALGRRYQEVGLPIAVLLGGADVRFRMFPSGAGQLVEGWTKNMAIGAGAVPWRRTALAGLWVTALLAAARDLPGLPGGSGLPAPARGAAYAAFALQVGVMGRRTGAFGPLTSVAYPAPLLAFVALVARSEVHTRIRRRVTWRGRSIALRPPPAAGG